jgi:peroxiredoxin
VDRKSPYIVPPGLPVPVDDGACGHLRAMRVPAVALRSTSGADVNLADIAREPAVLFFFPRTGVPGQPASDDWDLIPGARGCTPQSCGFRDLHDEFRALGVKVYGLSTSTPAHQLEFVTRNHVPYEMLSDERMDLVRVMRLPTFEHPVESGGPSTLIRRMAWFVDNGRIQRVWYPVFPPDQCAAVVLQWLRERPARA